MRLASLTNRAIRACSNKHKQLVQTVPGKIEVSKSTSFPIQLPQAHILPLPNIGVAAELTELEVNNNFEASMRELIKQNKYEEAVSLFESEMACGEVKNLTDLDDILAVCVRSSNDVAIQIFDLVRKQTNLANFQRSLAGCIENNLFSEVFNLIKEQPNLADFEVVFRSFVRKGLGKEVLDLFVEKNVNLKYFSGVLLDCGKNELELESLQLLEEIPFSVSEDRIFELFELIEKQANPKAFPNLLSACANYYFSLGKTVLDVWKVGQFQGKINEQKISIKLDQEVYISGKVKGKIKSYLQGFFEVQNTAGKTYKIVAENLIKHNPDILPVGMSVKVFNQDVLYAGFNKNNKGEIVSFKVIDKKKNIFEIPSKIFQKENKLLLRDENFVLDNLHLIPNNINVFYGAGQEGLIKGLTENKKYFLVQNNKTNQNDEVLIEEIIRMNISSFRGIPPAKISEMGQTKLTYELKLENWIKATKYKVSEIEVILPNNSSVNVRDEQIARVNGEKYVIKKQIINMDSLTEALDSLTAKIEKLEVKAQRIEESLELTNNKLSLARVNALRKIQAKGINIEDIIYFNLFDSADYIKLSLYHHPKEQVNKRIQKLIKDDSSVTESTLKHISILNDLAVPVEEYLLAQIKDNNAVADYGESYILGIEDIPEFVGEVFGRYLIQGFPAPKSALQNLKVKQERVQEIENLLRSHKFYSLNELNRMKESGELDKLLEKFPDIQETIDILEEGNILRKEQEKLENWIIDKEAWIKKKWRHLNYSEDLPVYSNFHNLKEAINSWSDIGESYLNRAKAFIENYILSGVSQE